MKTLFIDTHSEKLMISIIDGDRVYSRVEASSRSHSEIAVPTLEKVLEEAKITLKELNEIIVVNGPGSFTGVRIGVTIAKTIAYSLNIPIKTITSLEAYGISDDSDFDIITVKDSKGVYSALRKNNTFTDFEYRKTNDFENYVHENNYKVSDNSEIDLSKILVYLQGVQPINAHQVNPIYIKEIDALK